MQSTTLAALEQEALSKAHEWQAAEAQHIEGLREVLTRRQTQLTTLQGRYQRLREDFVYNLGLLQQRDAELERLTRMEVSQQEILASRDQVVNDLRLQLDTAAETLAAMQERLEAQQDHFEVALKKDKVVVVKGKGF